MTRLAATAWIPTAYTGREPAATFAFADDPDVVWPADWEISGNAFTGSVWSADVYGDLDQPRRGNGPFEVLLYTPLGTFQGVAFLAAEQCPYVGQTTALMDGRGPLAPVPAAATT